MTFRTNGPKLTGMLETPRSLLALWPSLEEVASDFRGAGMAVSASQVSKWAQRGRIPAEFHAPLVRFAEARGIDGVTFDALALMHAPEPFLAEARA